MRFLAALLSSSRWSVLVAPCLIALVLLGPAAPAQGAETTPSTPLLGAWYSHITSSLTNRNRVVQVCMVTMCLALLILMKKFAGNEWPEVRGQRSEVNSQETSDPRPPTSDI